MLEYFPQVLLQEPGNTLLAFGFHDSKILDYKYWILDSFKLIMLDQRFRHPLHILQVIKKGIHHMPAIAFDGNGIGQLNFLEKWAIHGYRIPEIATYRYYGHSVADANAKKYRTPEEIEKYKTYHDPVRLWRPGANEIWKSAELQGQQYKLGVTEYWPHFTEVYQEGPGGPAGLFPTSLRERRYLDQMAACVRRIMRLRDADIAHRAGRAP